MKDGALHRLRFRPVGSLADPGKTSMMAITGTSSDRAEGDQADNRCNQGLPGRPQQRQLAAKIPGGDSQSRRTSSGARDANARRAAREGSTGPRSSRRVDRDVGASFHAGKHCSACRGFRAGYSGSAWRTGIFDRSDRRRFAVGPVPRPEPVAARIEPDPSIGVARRRSTLGSVPPPDSTPAPDSAHGVAQRCRSDAKRERRDDLRPSRPRWMGTVAEGDPQGHRGQA